MLQSYWGVMIPNDKINNNLIKLVDKHCQGGKVTAMELYKAVGSKDTNLLIQLIGDRAPTKGLSHKELETLLAKLEQSEGLEASESDSISKDMLEAYKLPKLSIPQTCTKNYCKKGRCITSLAQAIVAAASNDEEKKAADRIVAHCVVSHLKAQGHNIGTLLAGCKPIDWSQHCQPLTINWNNTEGVIELWKGETAIINSGDSLVLLDNPDQPIVPNNSKIYFEADREGSYHFTSFHSPGPILTLNIHDKDDTLSYLPKLPKQYHRDFLHQIRRWIALDNYLKQVELNNLNSVLEDRQAILGRASDSVANEKRLFKAISDTITDKALNQVTDPVCRIVFDAWKKSASNSELLLECLEGGKVSFAKVTSIINRQLTLNTKARERLQRELQAQLRKQ